MGEWAFLGSLLDAVQLQSPLVGRLWLVVMLIFRILVLATVGGAVFEDEQEEFVCNTLQPGCRQTCYDRAFPVSHYRFWLFHILLLSAPPVLFVIYSVHRAGKGADGADAGPGPPPRRRCYLLAPLPTRTRRRPATARAAVAAARRPSPRSAGTWPSRGGQQSINTAKSFCPQSRADMCPWPCISL
ncbi:gap junction delta-3 protein [Crocuta crocuta]